MNSEEKGLEGEKFVNEIAFKSFLKYWCYPSPKNENGDKKEICDLLIIFKDTIVIVSVKNYEFKGNYQRYFKKTITKALKQIFGAERKLLLSKEDIYIKHPDRSKEKFPKSAITKVFRVIVNLGEGVKFYPFNKKTKNEKFVTLLDKEAFKTLVEELDTIPDFIEYLEKREKKFSDKTVVVLPSEENDFPFDDGIQFFEYSTDIEKDTNQKYITLSGTEHDLLASYLENDRNFPSVLSEKDYTHMYLQLDDSWKELKNSSIFKNKKKHDEVSYLIDELVKRELLTNNDEKAAEISKYILSLDRFNRRTLAKSFLGFVEMYKDLSGMNFARRYQDFNGLGIIFVFYSLDMPEHMVSTLTHIAIDSFCLYSNYKSKNIVLIAMTNKLRQMQYKLLKDIKPFSREDEEIIKANVQKLGWFTTHQEVEFTEKEYPEE